MNEPATRAFGPANQWWPGKVPAWVWLASGIALQLVANGRWIATPAAWLAPVGWLVFLERSSIRKAVPVAFSMFALVEFIAWRGLVPAPGALYYIIVGSYTIVYFLPFLVHRLTAPRMNGIAATLVFPTSWIGFEYAFQQWGTPYGSWFSIAYTQIDILPLAQIASVAGTAGISFIVTWFASVLALFLRPTRGDTPRSRIALACGLVVAMCLAYGEIRLAQTRTSIKTTRVAGLVPSPELSRALETGVNRVRRGGELTEDQMLEIVEAARRLNDDLFARTVREARAGARLVAWSETAGRVLDSGERDLLERAKQLALEEDIDLLLAYGVWTPQASPPFQNKVAAMSRTGQIEWEYEKARPIVGPESPFVRAGDGVVRAMEAHSGLISAVICHDLDFPTHLRKAHQIRAGLVVGPSDDWSDITPLHANMARLRSIEYGFSLFRPTSSGRSIAVDSRGRTLMAVDYATDAVVANVAVVSTRTIYGTLGDWFSWVCLAGSLVLVGLALRSGRNRQASRNAEVMSHRTRSKGEDS